jgi:hypothetical protein
MTPPFGLKSARFGQYSAITAATAQAGLRE